MEDFVTFEIAKKLKEKGFREDCIAQVKPDNTIIFNHVFDNDIRTIIKCHNKLKPYVDAPTISQVMKWLREEKKYHIEFVGNACGYLFIVSDIPSEGGTDRYCSDYGGPNDGGTWDKYEDCAIAGIEYVLDNLI